MIRRFLCGIGWHAYEDVWLQYPNLPGWEFPGHKCRACGDEDHLF